MYAKDIRFAKEYRFNIRIPSDELVGSLQVKTIYNYQILSGDLFLEIDADKYVKAEILDNREDIIQEINMYSGCSLLRVDAESSQNGTYLLTLLEFYQHISAMDEYQIVIDAAADADLRKRNMSPKQAVQYLKSELVLNERYWFAFGNDRASSELRLLGKNIVVAIKQSLQGYLHVVSIGKKPTEYDGLITMFSGKIEIKDSAADARRITDAFRREYERAIKDNVELVNLWKIYDNLDLEAEKKKARELGTLKYSAFERRGRNIVFRVDGGYVTSDFLDRDTQYAALALENYNHEDPLDYKIRDAIILGNEYDRACVNTTEFVISDEEIDAFGKIPKVGYIVPSIGGSKMQSSRRDVAQKKIKSGDCILPGLGLLLQTGEVIGSLGENRPAVSEHLRKNIFGKHSEKDFNSRQKKAIEIAINTPDIALIQGPPGTGKTKVIQAIIERINELENGTAKILVSSTQHDAVDNAVKNVTYSGVPVNRAVKRSRSALNTEGANAPVFHWIDEMIASCDRWMDVNSAAEKSINCELDVLLAEIRSAHASELKGCLNDLYTHLLKLPVCSEELLKKAREVMFVAESGASEKIYLFDERLAELLEMQATDPESYRCEEGVNAHEELELYLKHDCDTVSFEVPSYWKALRRTDREDDTFNELFSKFAYDIKTLKGQNEENKSDNTATLKKEIEELISAVEAETIQMSDFASDTQKLYDLVWQFKHNLSNYFNVKNLITAYSRVNAATCQQSANRHLSPGMLGFDDKYDYVIVDEAARSNPLDLMIPMTMGKKIILVGDHKQLPHMVERDIVDAVVEKTKDESARQVLEESLFMRLFNKVREADRNNKNNPDFPVAPERTCTLNEQFRMHSAICELINLFYQEEHLETACDDNDKQHGLGLYNNNPIAWIDVPRCEKYPQERGDRSVSRRCEIDVVERELHKILAANSEFNIGVITFYKKQADELDERIQNVFPGDAHRISVGTVDAFQGKEFDIVILSTVRSNRETELKKRVGFLNNANRLCVAFSRAQRLLVVVGDSETVAADAQEVYIKPLYELLCQSQRKDIGYYEKL